MRKTITAFLLLVITAPLFGQTIDESSKENKKRKIEFKWLKNARKRKVTDNIKYDTIDQPDEDLAIPYEINPVSSLVEFSEIRKVSGLSNREIFILTKLWLTSTFKTNSEVLSSEDIEAGILMRRGWIDIQIPTTIRMYFTIRVDVKDNRYKTTFYKISYKTYKSESSPSYEYDAEFYFDNPKMVRRSGEEKPIAKKYINETSVMIQAMRESLYLELQSSVKNSDW